MVLLVIVSSLGGCAPGGISRRNAVDVAIQKHAAGKAHIAWSSAYMDDNDLVVTGVVRRDDTVGPPIDVTVYADIVSPDGSILDHAQSDCMHVPRRMINRIQGFERFRMRFPIMPPAGASIQLVARSQ